MWMRTSFGIMIVPKTDKVRTVQYYPNPKSDSKPILTLRNHLLVVRRCLFVFEKSRNAVPLSRKPLKLELREISKGQILPVLIGKSPITVLFFEIGLEARCQFRAEEAECEARGNYRNLARNARWTIYCIPTVIWGASVYPQYYGDLPYIYSNLESYSIPSVLWRSTVTYSNFESYLQ